MSSHDDDLARLRAEIDQAREGLREVAAALWTLFSELTEQGFQRSEALDLTRIWLIETMNTPSDDG